MPLRKIKYRRNFLPTFLLTLLGWLLLIYLVVGYRPEGQLVIFVFYSLVFISSFLTFSLLLGHTRRGFLLATLITLLLFLKQIGQAHLLNFILLTGLLLSIELYCRRYT